MRFDRFDFGPIQPLGWGGMYRSGRKKRVAREFLVLRTLLREMFIFLSSANMKVGDTGQFTAVVVFRVDSYNSAAVLLVGDLMARGDEGVW